MLSQSPYLQNSQLVQRPANNVVPTIPPSSASYYSASAGKVNLFIHGFVLKNFRALSYPSYQLLLYFQL